MIRESLEFGVLTKLLAKQNRKEKNYYAFTMYHRCPKHHGN